MEQWEKDLQQHNLQKAVNAEFGYNMPLETLLEKAAPIGTRKTWQGGREFVKTAEGWKPVSKKKESKESGGFSDLSDVELLNEYNVVKDALRNDRSFNQKPSLPSEIETYKKQLKQIESEIQKRNEKLNKLLKEIPDNGATAHLMRKQSGIKEKEEVKTQPEKKDEGKSSLSKENLKKQDVVVKKIENRLEEVGFARHHKNFEVLKNTYDEFKKKGDVLSDKIKDVELRFSFEPSWYDQRTRASLTGLVGVKKRDLIDKYNKEYLEKRQGLAEYGSTNHWLAGKLKELCDSTGVKTSGGSSSFSYDSESVSIYLAHGELK